MIRATVRMKMRAAEWAKYRALNETMEAQRRRQELNGGYAHAYEPEMSFIEEIKNGQ